MGIPNNFWYVCPVGVIDIGDVPEYAGLIYVDNRDSRFIGIDYIKKAPYLHKNKLTTDDKLELLQKICKKYWYIRKNYSKNESV